MSQPQGSSGNPGGGSENKPSIRLSLSGNRPPAAKKRRFTPTNLPPHTASVSNVTLLHQNTSLDFVLQPTLSSDPIWHAQGQTTLYVIDEGSAVAGSTVQPLALHLRASCQVETVQVQSVNPKLTELQSLRTSYHHADPLKHVLLKPAVSYTEDDIDRPPRLNADAQSSRGAVGMTIGLRVASIASNMGELRLTFERPPPITVPLGEAATKVWSTDLNKNQYSTTTDGAAVQRLQEKLQERATTRREKRIALVAQRLGEKTNRSLKITVRYRIPLSKPIMHLGGLHCSTISRTPHIYTTTGVLGDHEGPRCWVPCLDSASVKHRASHQVTIKVTAPMKEGISCVGLGEDFGCAEAFLHDSTWDVEQAKKELGARHFEMIESVAQQATRGTQTHWIPPDETLGRITSIAAIRATNVWCSCSWAPVPARTMGFAVGPFKVLEDPEYFGPSAVMEEDDESGTVEERHEAFVDAARKNGEGIRQAYFAPLFERKHIHVEANAVLLPNTEIRIAPLSAREKEMANEFDKTFIYMTVGVPHRALTLMRDVLALPSYRTSSYTQVWIPNAVHGGSSCGALHSCPEVLVNPFLGGAIMDSRLLPPVNCRLPYYQGGRVIQFMQARCAVRGWITASLPLGGNDDVGNGYIYSLMESFIMSVYERGHGEHGQGGARGSVFFTRRYSIGGGLNSANLDFLPVQNIEEMDIVVGGVGTVPVEDRQNDYLWRSATNGSESHTSSIDEFNARHLLYKDVVEAFERVTDKDKNVPSPSMGWFGSHLSLSFLSSNATSSSDLGCGALELMHPIGGLVYRTLKSEVFRGVVEGRAGVANLIRLMRAAFVAAHLDDNGEKELKLAAQWNKKSDKDSQGNEPKTSTDKEAAPPKPPFVVCVNEILKKKGLTHTLFTRALQNLSGRIREPHLAGTLVDVDRRAEDPRTRRPFVDPEGFPNSYVRGASLLYCRVGVHVEQSRDGGLSQAESAALIAKGIQLQVYAEPIIPQGGISYGGPVTLRVVENEGQFREYVKDLAPDGSRRDWGATFLHAKPVTTLKAQTAASGTIESSTSTTKDGSNVSGAEAGKSTALGGSVSSSVFTESFFHSGGYQAIELIRLTNLTPLLWARVDPHGLYGGRISVFQPDACLAEQLFHDGDSAAQVDAMRALAERPLKIQGSVKVTTVYDVNVSELPVRVLGDCLRGSPALHSSLPHTPAVRSQAALAIAQWQNNKAPPSKDSVGVDSWIGINLLIQYFRERFYSNAVVMPVKFSRLMIKKSEADVRQAPNKAEGSAPNSQPSYDDTYQYLDTFEEGEERAAALDDAEEVEMEEDEEYRVRSAVVTAIASIRAKDGFTPTIALRFLETVLEAEDAEVVGNLVYPDEELMVQKTFRELKGEDADTSDVSGEEEVSSELLTPSLSYVPSVLISDALLALCYVNAAPAVFTDPATGKTIQAEGNHPVSRLIEIAKGWLEWELYRENIRTEVEVKSMVGLAGNSHDLIAACAIVALSNLAILKQSTTGSSTEDEKSESLSTASVGNPGVQLGKNDKCEEVCTAQYYINIFCSEPRRNDLTRAACAQAIVCICCAADRFEKEGVPPFGLLSALELLFDAILDNRTSPSLRQTLALIMMDACTGKACSMQRVGSIGGRNDLCTAAARFANGSLGASHGGDNGSALLMSVTAGSFPAASAVNDGARRGLRLLCRAGHSSQETLGEGAVVRVARFATRLWRTINGESASPPPDRSGDVIGVSAYDGILRCSLLALFQWIWPKGCKAVIRVQDWKIHENPQRYEDLGAHHVMKISEEERAAATAEENSFADFNDLVDVELDRQAWRGEMAMKAFDIWKASKGSAQVDVAAAEQGIGQPLPPIKRDTAFKQGGWIASAAQQRRALLNDGLTVVKVRLKVKSSTEG